MIEDVELVDGAVVGFRTRRLRARRLLPDDERWLSRLHQDGDVMAMIGGVRDAPTSADWLRANLDVWDALGFGQWVLETDEESSGAADCARSTTAWANG